MQPHDHSPLNDFIEYPEEHMLARSTDFLKAMQRPNNERAYMLIIAGYPAANATIPKHAKQKKPLTEIASFL